jgi:hypothetical protein
MYVLQGLLIFDMSSMVLMLVLLYLSRRLGEALKIAPYYRLLYVTTVLIFIASGIDAFHESFPDPYFGTISIIIRAAAGCIAVAACLPYWKWLFAEYFFKQG